MLKVVLCWANNVSTLLAIDVLILGLISFTLRLTSPYFLLFIDSYIASLFAATSNSLPVIEGVTLKLPPDIYSFAFLTGTLIFSAILSKDSLNLASSNEFSNVKFWLAFSNWNSLFTFSKYESVFV